MNLDPSERPLRLSVCLQPLYPLGLDGALAAVRKLDVDAVELPVDAQSPLVELRDLTSGGAAAFKRRLADRGVAISALSIHQEGQLLLGPHHADTDGVFRGTPAEKSAYARERMLLAARAAAELGVPIVVGFVGAEDYTRFFPWPDEHGWEKSQAVFVERMSPILDEYRKLGVVFAHEPHPKQFVYNTETALESVKLLSGHPAWRFNLDPANLILAGVDPVVFVAELKDRVVHVHAKDAEIVAHNAARSGLLAHGAWDRPDRGFRFRIPGWGDVPWKRLVTELVLQGYRGHLAIENEDPIFHPLDGLAKAADFLRPLLPVGGRSARWW